MKFDKFVILSEAKELEEALNEGGGLPKGWTNDSLDKFAKSLTGKAGDEKGFFDACVKKIGNNVSNPQAFCASIKDKYFKAHGAEDETKWRGKGKSKKQAKKDTGED